MKRVGRRLYQKVEEQLEKAEPLAPMQYDEESSEEEEEEEEEEQPVPVIPRFPPPQPEEQVEKKMKLMPPVLAALVSPPPFVDFPEEVKETAEDAAAYEAALADAKRLQRERTKARSEALRVAYAEYVKFVAQDSKGFGLLQPYITPSRISEQAVARWRGYNVLVSSWLRSLSGTPKATDMFRFDANGLLPVWDIAYSAKMGLIPLPRKPMLMLGPSPPPLEAIYLSIRAEGRQGHLNILLIDHARGLVYLYEPHDRRTSDDTGWYAPLEKLIQKEYGSKGVYKVIEPPPKLPGPQTTEAKSALFSDVVLIGRKGKCAVWCTIWLQLILNGISPDAATMMLSRLSPDHALLMARAFASTAMTTFADADSAFRKAMPANKALWPSWVTALTVARKEKEEDDEEGRREKTTGPGRGTRQTGNVPIPRKAPEKKRERTTSEPKKTRKSKGQTTKMNAYVVPAGASLLPNRDMDVARLQLTVADWMRVLQYFDRKTITDKKEISAIQQKGKDDVKKILHAEAKRTGQMWDKDFTKIYVVLPIVGKEERQTAKVAPTIAKLEKMATDLLFQGRPIPGYFWIGFPNGFPPSISKKAREELLLSDLDAQQTAKGSYVYDFKLWRKATASGHSFTVLDYWRTRSDQKRQRTVADSRMQAVPTIFAGKAFVAAPDRPWRRTNKVAVENTPRRFYGQYLASFVNQEEEGDERGQHLVQVQTTPTFHIRYPLPDNVPTSTDATMLAAAEKAVWDRLAPFRKSHNARKLDQLSLRKDGPYHEHWTYRVKADQKPFFAKLMLYGVGLVLMHHHPATVVTFEIGNQEKKWPLPDCISGRDVSPWEYATRKQPWFDDVDMPPELNVLVKVVSPYTNKVTAYSTLLNELHCLLDAGLAMSRTADYPNINLRWTYSNPATAASVRKYAWTFELLDL